MMFGIEAYRSRQEGMETSVTVKLLTLVLVERAPGPEDSSKLSHFRNLTAIPASTKTGPDHQYEGRSMTCYQLHGSYNRELLFEGRWAEEVENNEHMYKMSKPPTHFSHPHQVTQVPILRTHTHTPLQASIRTYASISFHQEHLTSATMIDCNFG